MILAALAKEERAGGIITGPASISPFRLWETRGRSR